jgi:Ni,Fe-hydrogenase maturation factor
MTSPTADSQSPQARFAVISFERHPETSSRVAQQVNEHFRAFGLQNLATVNVDDLTPELAGQLARVDYAIFIDSPRMGNRVRVKVRPLEALGSEPAGSTTPGGGHSWDPSSLLALAHSAYGSHPQSWLVQVYLPKAEPLPAGTVDEALNQAIQAVEGLIGQFSGKMLRA